MLREILIGNAQNRDHLLIQQRIINRICIGIPRKPLIIRRTEPAALRQQIKVDQIGIPRKAGRRLIGRIAVAGRGQRKHLPVMAARPAQEIYPFICCFAELADTVLGRQRRDRQQDSAFSHWFLLLAVQCPLLKYSEIPHINETEANSMAAAAVTAQITAILRSRSARFSMPLRAAFFLQISRTAITGRSNKPSRK